MSVPHMDAYLKTASCNKAKGLGWCRKCAKCAWVFLATTSLFSHDLAVSKAGGDLFADPELSGLYEAMAGLPGAGDKPFECTGTEEEVRSAIQDLGTGARTVLAIITAEVLGLKVSDIKSNIGNSTFPPGQSSGGSTTTPSMSPPTFTAASQARDELFKRIAPDLNVKPEDLSVANGQVLVAGLGLELGGSAAVGSEVLEGAVA